MKIFKWIRKCFEKIRDRFGKAKRDLDYSSDKAKFEEKSLEKIETRINQIVEQPTPAPPGEIRELAKIQAESELNGESRVVKTNLFPSLEIQEELTSLNEKLIRLQIKQKQTDRNLIPTDYLIDKDIEALERAVKQYDGLRRLKLSISVLDKAKELSLKIENFVRDQTLTKAFQKREVERVKQFKKFKKEIEDIQRAINKSIDQNAFVEAKSSIRKLEILLKSIQALAIKIAQVKEKKNSTILLNLISKTATLKVKLITKEEEIEAKRQADELKIRQEEIEKRILAEKAKIEEEKQIREREVRIKRQEEEAKRKKEEDKKLELQKLLAKKSNWQEFAQVLKENGISKLYHFTDIANMSSIKEKGGLFSWYYCDQNQIRITREGGSPISRELDRRHNLHDYVRLSFCKNHPMQYRLQQAGYSLVLLEIAVDVVFFENTRFSNINATDNDHLQGCTLADLKRIKFSATTRSYLRKDDPDFKFHQAEVMVKTWVPTEFITNVNWD